MPFPFKEKPPKKKEEKEEYLSDKYGIEGEEEVPEELIGKAIIYIDNDGKTKWILHPDYINPKEENKELIEKAKKILKDAEIWPLG
ncbi:MAG: hypothetical protein ACP5JU_02080 [Minisyncoccia bacterium]